MSGLRQRCKTCGYWERTTDDGKGICRYGPPGAWDVTLRGLWPGTHETDSCGKGLPSRFPDRFEGRDQRDPNVRP